MSIARFIAKECNLAGENNFAQAQADAIVDCLVEVPNAYYSQVAFAKTDKVYKLK